jgi:hypothetical protein
LNIDYCQRISNGLGIFVFCSAILSSAMLISGEQMGRVNLLYLLMLFVAWPVMAIILAALLSFSKTDKGMVSILLAVPIWPRLWVNALHKLKADRLFQPWLFCQSQKVALTFSAGCLLAFMFVLIFNDVTFVWRSTLISAEQLYPLLQWVAVPWLLIESAQPILSMVEASQDSRLSLNLNPHLLGASSWWQYILMAQLTYAIVPRLILYCYSLKLLANTKRDLQPLSMPDNDPRNLESNPRSLVAVSHSKTHLANYALLNWTLLPEPLYRKFEMVMGEPKVIYSLGASGSIAQEQAAIEESTLKVLVVAAWEPPMGELADFMQLTNGIIIPLDWHKNDFQKVSALHLDEWRRFCYAFPDWQLQLPKALS